MELTVGKTYYDKSNRYEAILRTIFDDSVVIQYGSDETRGHYCVMHKEKFKESYSESIKEIKEEQLQYKIKGLKSYIERNKKELERLKKELIELKNFK